MRLKLILTLSEVDSELLKALPTVREMSELNRAKDCLKAFEPVTKQLQDPSMNLNDVRMIFDQSIQDYPSLVNYLAADATLHLKVQFAR